ncbi:MAG: hypothetical protein Kapaf2KO_19350 [Candidatus Kapaibacteriales bacterium]
MKKLIYTITLLFLGIVTLSAQSLIIEQETQETKAKIPAAGFDQAFAYITVQNNTDQYLELNAKLRFLRSDHNYQFAYCFGWPIEESACIFIDTTYNSNGEFFNMAGIRMKLNPGEEQPRGDANKIQVDLLPETNSGIVVLEVVLYTDDESIMESFTQYFLIGDVESVEETADLENAFPNPTREFVTVNYELLDNASNEFKVISTDGSIIHQDQLYGKRGAINLDVSSYPVGSYTIVVGGASVKKFTVAK